MVRTMRSSSLQTFLQYTLLHDWSNTYNAISVDSGVVARLFKLGGQFIRWKIVGGAREKTSDKKTVPLYNTRSAIVP